MKQFYMDSNVFISRLKQDDVYHSDGVSIVKSLERGEIQAETSVLTLLEVASVSSRLYEAGIGVFQNEKERRAFVMRVLFELGSLKTKFINIAGDSPLPIKRIQATLPNVFNEAILLVLECTLRSLDLIHLAAAKHAKRMNGELGAFVTGDRGFLDNKKQLSELIGMPILSPKEYVEALGLK